MAFSITDEVVDNLIRMFENIRDCQFEVGDYLIDLVEKVGFDKTQLINHLAGALHISASTLYDYYRISKKWTKPLREQYQHLDWTFYRNTNPDNPEDIALLEQAIDEGWNVSRLKSEKYGDNTVSEDIQILITIIKRLGGKITNSERKKKIIEQIVTLISELERED